MRNRSSSSTSKIWVRAAMSGFPPHWQMDGKGAAFAAGALALDMAAMFGDDLLNQGQPQACAFLLGSIKRLEYPLDLILGHTFAIVANTQKRLFAITPGADRHFAAIGHRFAAVT